MAWPIHDMYMTQLVTLKWIFIYMLNIYILPNFKWTSNYYHYKGDAYFLLLMSGNRQP